MKYIIYIYIFILIVTCQTNTYNQNNDLYLPLNFQKAYQNQTRATDGKPGKNYWQNRANYNIQIELNPKTRLVSGTESIIYFNNSPDNLSKLYIHLFPNYYKKGSTRDYEIHPDDAGDGVNIKSVELIGKDNSVVKTVLEGMNLVVYLPEPLQAKDSLTIEIDWEYIENEKSHNRTGMVDESSFFIAYFFPRIAVYDDIDGWNDYQYKGLIEFYNDFGDFDVSITVPKNYIVWATGILQNPYEVLNKKYADKFINAISSDEIVHIVETSDYTENVTKANAKNTWYFRAENVSDFAFGTSNHYLWDATSLEVDSITKRRVLIEAAYNPSSKDFYEVAQIAKQSIHYMSTNIPGVPFPFPSETVFNGLSEMEYPMMVNDHSLHNMQEVIKLTSHEIFHSYFPFYMGFNETKYAWMDEGWASYGDYLISQEIDTTIIPEIFFTKEYLELAGTDWDVPMMTNSEILGEPTYWSNSYVKPATFLAVLNDELGEDLFKKWILEFMNRWNGKHPTPYDYFYTLNEVVGESLNWLIKPWFFEYGFVDIAIEEVENNKIVIENIGGYPYPVDILITYSNEGKSQIHLKASVWAKGNRSYELKLEDNKAIKKVEILDFIIPDVNLSNNIYHN